jgi:hypothetical protein
MVRKFSALVTIMVAIGIGAFVLMKGMPGATDQEAPSSFAELVALPEPEMNKVDVALMNLLCAQGLPGAESLDKKQSLALLDQWAEVVRRAEQKYLPECHRNPGR